MRARKGISPFSVLLLCAVASACGLACLSMLKLQYTPSQSSRDVVISYNYPLASARIVESEVTSLIEGSVNSLSQTAGVSSLSSLGGGRVTVTMDKGTDPQKFRFELATRIRNLVPKLPAGCSYPQISLNVGGKKSSPAISYMINSSLPTKEIAALLDKQLLYPLSIIEGVSGVNVSGVTDNEILVTFDSPALESLGLSVNDIVRAISSWGREQLVGVYRDESRLWAVKFCTDISKQEFSQAQVGTVGDRIIRLGDVADISFQEADARSYFRLNGLNTLTLTVELSSDENMLAVIGDIKRCVADARASLPETLEMTIGYDYSEYVSQELHKILWRTLLCLLILIVFVLIVKRSWRYTLVISLTLAANLLVSAAVYYLTGLHIHIYTLAGITVSLGIIIDNCIVMVDHYCHHRDRSVFPALFSAVLTTVSALLVILLLPESEKANLVDFAYVIIINLSVSLLIAYFFVPALLEMYPVSGGASSRASVRRLRRIVRWNGRYGAFIAWGAAHKWVFVIVLVLAFGIPTCLLPDSFSKDGRKPEKKYEKVLDKIVKFKPYSSNKATIDKVIGTSFALFNRSVDRFNFYREPERPFLHISAAMPEGCSLEQMNEVVSRMEQYLGGIEQIEMFRTNIRSYDNASIEVWFLPEYEYSDVPLTVKSQVIRQAANFGGASWRVSGIDNSSFNNHIATGILGMNSIELTGYNYDYLISYAEQLCEHLSANRRIVSTAIRGGDGRYVPLTEYNVSYDREALALSGVSPYEYYSSLHTRLYDYVSMNVPSGGEYVDVHLRSSEAENFDNWHVDNVAVELGDNAVKLSQIGGITKQKTGLPIRKDNQTYCVTVVYDFVGAINLAKKVAQQSIEYMNSEVLPVGFLAKGMDGGWFYENKDKYAGLLLLVIVCIFIILAVQFNSLRYPLAIILMVPVSFIGIFLTFGLSDFTFDKGGFASFIMVSGITVNAGIYLVQCYLRRTGAAAGRGSLRFRTRQYLKAFNEKIHPILLTVLSTVLGLIPFLFDGPAEVFWFCFAIGTISGMIFSLIALAVFLPVFAIKKKS